MSSGVPRCAGETWTLPGRSSSCQLGAAGVQGEGVRTRYDHTPPGFGPHLVQRLLQLGREHLLHGSLCAESSHHRELSAREASPLLISGRGRLKLGAP